MCVTEGHEVSIDSGWTDSAEAYIAFQDRGDPNRALLLDPVMLDLCGAVRGRSVLDIGCGEGRFSRMLADAGAVVVGIDATSGMIAEAMRRRECGSEYAVAAAESLPLRDASVDLCVSYITLVDIVAYVEAIAEMARVLKPGGELIVPNLGFVRRPMAGSGTTAATDYTFASIGTRRSGHGRSSGLASASSIGTGR